MKPADDFLIGKQFRRLPADIIAADSRGLNADPKFLRGLLDVLVGIGLADIGLLHHERTRLLQNFKLPVSGAADCNPVIARRGLDPDVFESGLARNPAVGHAVQRHAAGNAEIPGAGGFAQPAGACQQHLFGVVLNAPGEILPVPHRGTRFPFAAAVHHIRLVELRRPARHMQRVAGDIQQRLDPFVAAVGGEAHQLAAFIPVAENVGRGPAVKRAETRHVVKLIAEESAIRLHPDFFQTFDLRAAEFVIALRLAGERRRRVR
jgi:hypothetical protein